jgi:Lon protease-like protein
VQPPPIDIEQIKRDFRGEVRIYPQPSLVLLPDGFAPVRVFEDRYTELLRDAAEDDKLVGLALLEPGYEDDYLGTPPVYDTVCIGRLLQYKAQSHEKCEALLYGLFRARIRRHLDAYPYRRAEVEILDEVAGRETAEEIARSVHRALELVPGKKSVIFEMRRMATQLRGMDATAGRVADAVADASDLLPGERYALLSEPDVLRRLNRLIEILEQRAYAESPACPPGSRPELN